MTDYPIIMSGPMVRALLDGRKTQTRRLAWRPAKPGAVKPWYRRIGEGQYLRPTIWQDVEPGDRLWVKETLVIENDSEYLVESKPPNDRPVKCVDGGFDWGHYHLIPHYRATEPEPHIVPPDLEDETDDKTRWRSSRYMPRWASRLTLTVTETRLQELLCGALGEGDAVAEGLLLVFEDNVQKWAAWEGEDAFVDPTIAYNVVWDSLHGRGSFASNPEVVAMTFTVALENIGPKEVAT